MPEIKRTFVRGRMNKDLDDRLIPGGEYRDALNVELSTSESSNVGAIQNTIGNTIISSIDAVAGYLNPLCIRVHARVTRHPRVRCTKL